MDIKLGNNTWRSELNERVKEKGVEAIEEWLMPFPDGYAKDAFNVVMAYLRDGGIQASKNAYINIVGHEMHSIPTILFKYVSLDHDNKNDEKLNTLRNKQIYLSAPKNLNDPFDCEGFFCDYTMLAKQLKHLGDFQRNKYEQREYVKVSALTTVGLDRDKMIFSVPMWAHYANNHKGFCVSYNLENENNTGLFAHCLPVKYAERRIDITKIVFLSVFGKLVEFANKNPYPKQPSDPIEIEDMLLTYVDMLLFNIKHNVWEHEKEVRCVVQRNEEVTDQYLSAIPLEIFIGKDCTISNAQRLFNIARGFDFDVPIYRMRKPESNDARFGLIADRITSIQEL